MDFIHELIDKRDKCLDIVKPLDTKDNERLSKVHFRQLLEDDFIES